MGHRILIVYGSYRSDRTGIRLAHYALESFRARGDDVAFIDAMALSKPKHDLVIDDREPAVATAIVDVPREIRDADGLVFITSEGNWGVQPGLKYLIDQFIEEWFWRPAAIASYSTGRLSGTRTATAWHGTLSEMGIVVVSSIIAVGSITQTLSAEGKPIGEGAKALQYAFPRFADDLTWWMEAAKAQRARKAPR